jgi:peroxiredoxin (alkyl hydroperoxide reductase subunit C)
MPESTADTAESSSPPGIGDQFPQLTVETSHGELTIPDDYEGKWLVLFSHPGDFTPVCTSEFVAFEQRREEFEELNAELLGLSVDRVHSHIKWTEWIEANLDVDIQFPIIADEQGSVGQRLGMIHANAGTSTVRSVFLIDPEGTVRIVLTYPMEIGRNIDEILRSLRALQMSDEEGVATPADWPENEKFGDCVLLSPPGTDADAEKRTAEAEDDDDLDYYDWWFTIKKQ